MSYIVWQLYTNTILVSPGELGWSVVLGLWLLLCFSAECSSQMCCVFW